jgi:hypothetical protein
MTGFPSFRRALDLLGRAAMIAIRAVNWVFLSQSPNNH